MPQVLSNLSDALAGSVDAASPLVVRIEGRERLPGTGIVWDSSGTIITAHHILERDDSIKIGIQDGETVEAELIGHDPTIDVAILRVPANSLAAPQGTEPDTLKVGHLALSLGAPATTFERLWGSSRPWDRLGGRRPVAASTTIYRPTP